MDWKKAANLATELTGDERELNQLQYDNKNTHYMFFDFGHDMTKIGTFGKGINDESDYVLIPT